ncbi:MAG: hypothetical protein K1W26_17660 [Acetatifactor sp.]
MVNNYSEFCKELLISGFSMAGGNARGIYAVVPFGWNCAPAQSPVAWHTGDPETDPWEWRMRVVQERDDIAYGKVFFGTGGYITREWYPCFLAVRRQGTVFDEWYDEGKASQLEKSIYETVSDSGRVALHDLKRICGIGKEDASRFDRALVNLQRNLFLTVCGQSQKKNKYGEEYGWSSNVFCTTEDFWGEDLSPDISSRDAFRKIHDRILELNPQAAEKNIRRFIQG